MEEKVRLETAVCGLTDVTNTQPLYCSHPPTSGTHIAIRPPPPDCALSAGALPAGAHLSPVTV